jgi:tRNA pseudouridine38-40 synthase
MTNGQGRKRNLKLTIEYDGTDYFGWQTQKTRHQTIQITLEKTLRKILSEKISVVASGRTDAGVHALSQTAHFFTASCMERDRLYLGLNALLPAGIVVSWVEEAKSDFNVLASARGKTYRYLILNRRPPSALLKDRVCFVHFKLDVGLMRTEAQCLVGRHDFKAFCASASSAKTTTRTIKRITITRLAYDPLFMKKRRPERSLIAIDIEADGFLYNMVRNIVGSLMEVGRGRFAPGSIKEILDSGNRRCAGPTAPACGLYLAGVKY